MRAKKDRISVAWVRRISKRIKKNDKLQWQILVALKKWRRHSRQRSDRPSCFSVHAKRNPQVKDFCAGATFNVPRSIWLPFSTTTEWSLAVSNLRVYWIKGWIWSESREQRRRVWGDHSFSNDSFHRKPGFGDLKAIVCDLFASRRKRSQWANTGKLRAHGALGRWRTKLGVASFDGRFRSATFSWLSAMSERKGLPRSFSSNFPFSSSTGEALLRPVYDVSCNATLRSLRKAGDAERAMIITSTWSPRMRANWRIMIRPTPGKAQVTTSIAPVVKGTPIGLFNFRDFHRTAHTSQG